MSIGKLHYRNDTDDVGFDEQRLPMHVIDGEGMLFTIVRDPIPVQKKFRMMVRYDPASIPMPTAYSPQERPHHPVLEDLRRFFGVDEPFDVATLQRVQAAYFAMTTYLDDNVGQILNALGDSGQEANTRVLYTSDHGDIGPW